MPDGQRIFSSSCTCVHVKNGDVVMADPFSSKRNDKYNLEQKQILRKLCLKNKLEAEAKPRIHWEPKRKKNVAPSSPFRLKIFRANSLVTKGLTRSGFVNDISNGILRPSSGLSLSKQN